MRLPGLFLCAGLMRACLCGGADWTQFRGSSHDGTSPEHIEASWLAAGLHQVWKIPMTGGFSSFVVAGGKAYTLGLKQIEGVDMEVCLALDAGTGRTLWS